MTFIAAGDGQRSRGGGHGPFRKKRSGARHLRGLKHYKPHAFQLSITSKSQLTPLIQTTIIYKML
jgi:hypothetical protein